MNAAILYIIAIMSVFFEFITIAITFHEYFNWRISLTWIGTLLAYVFLASLIDKAFPAIPLVFTNILSLVLINGYMLHKLLAVRLCLTLPISLLLNAAKRFIGGLFGYIIQNTLQANDPPIFMRSNLNWHTVYQLINLIGAETLTLPFIILLGIWGHHLVTKYAFSNFMHHAQVDGYDYLIVTFSVIIYTFVFYYDMRWSLGWQAFTTALFSMGFGALDIYLVMNKNTQLSDANLIKEMDQYNQLLKSRNQELHTFRHDYQNILLSMSEYLQKDDLQGLRDYFDSAVQPISDGTKENNGPETLKLIDDPDIVGILYAKYTDAQMADVKINISIADLIKVPTINRARLIRIINTIIDNALILAKENDHQIGLLIEQLSKDIRVTVTSELTNMKKINLNKLERQRFNSSGNQFGASLSTVKQLATKKIQVQYEVQEQLFISQILVKE